MERLSLGAHNEKTGEKGCVFTIYGKKTIVFHDKGHQFYSLKGPSFSAVSP